MSFEVTYKTITHPAFQGGLSKVLNTESKDHKIVYNLMRVGDLIDQNVKEAQRTYKKLAKNHDVLNEHGIIDTSADGNEEWRKAHEDFLKQTVKVERHKIRMEDIENVSLTPLELSALEPILDGIDGLAN